MDIYDFGVILLEVISGQPVTSSMDVNMLKDQVDIFSFSKINLLRYYFH